MRGGVQKEWPITNPADRSHIPDVSNILDSEENSIMRHQALSRMYLAIGNKG